MQSADHHLHQFCHLRHSSQRADGLSARVTIALAARVTSRVTGPSRQLMENEKQPCRTTPDRRTVTPFSSCRTDNYSKSPMSAFDPLPTLEVGRFLSIAACLKRIRGAELASLSLAALARNDGAPHANCAIVRFRLRRIARPSAPKPMSIIAQEEGSGTEPTVTPRSQKRSSVSFGVVLAGCEEKLLPGQRRVPCGDIAAD